MWRLHARPSLCTGAFSPFILCIIKCGEGLCLCERWVRDWIRFSAESYTWHIPLLLSMLPSALSCTVTLVASTGQSVINAVWRHWLWYLSLARLQKVAFKGAGSLRHKSLSSRGKSPLTKSTLNIGKGAGQKSPDFLRSTVLGLEVLARQRWPLHVACFLALAFLKGLLARKWGLTSQDPYLALGKRVENAHQFLRCQQSSVWHKQIYITDYLTWFSLVYWR